MRELEKLSLKRCSNRRGVAYGLMATCVIMVLVAAVSSYAAGPNLLANPSFECFAAGPTVTDEFRNVNNWQFFNLRGAGGSLDVVSPGQHGKKAIKLSRTSADGDSGIQLVGPGSYISPQVTHRYRVTFWARSADASPQTFRLAVASFSQDGSWLGDTLDARITPTSTWTQYSGEYVAPANTRSACISFRLLGVGSVEVDNVTFEDTAANLNLIANPGFESFAAGLTVTDPFYNVGNWQFFNLNGAGGKLDVVTPGQDGNVAIKVSRTSAEGDTGLQLVVPDSYIRVQVAHRYRVTFWVRSDDASPQTFRLAVASFSQDGSWLGDTLDARITPTSTWTQYSGEYIAPASTWNASISFRLLGVGSVEVDNVTFENTAAIIGNMIVNPSYECFVSGSIITDAFSSVSNWQFFNSNGAGGRLDVVTPGQEANVAIKLSRASADGDTGMQLGSYLPVQPAHRYRVTYWVRSDDASPQVVRLAVASFSQDNSWLGDTLDSWRTPTSTWSMFSGEYVAPANTWGAIVSFRLMGVGSAEIDNVSIEDVTEGAITGTVTSALSGGAIGGAGVLLQSLLSSDVPLPSPSFESFATDTTVTAEGFFYFGNWRFHNVNGAGGSLNAVSPGQDASPAVKLSRTSMDGDTGLGIETDFPTVYAGHTYKMTFWARSDDAGPQTFRIGMASFSQDNSWLGDQYIYCTPTATWTQYSGDYVVPANTSKTTLYFRLLSVGSVEVDNVSMEDITALSATTDSLGAYSLNVIPGVYAMTVTADGYSSGSISAIPALGTTVTQDMALMPAYSQTWAITDTFTRVDNSDLGHTEDVNALPWVKSSANTGSSIMGGVLVMAKGSAPCGASLGRDFKPADFQMSVQMTWLDFETSLWSGIAYRQSVSGVTDSGYFVKCPWEGDRIELWYQTTMVATAALPVPTSWVGVTLKVRAVGSRHMVWLNDQLLIDVVDEHNLDGGYVGLFCDQLNSVAWDNFDLSSYIVPETMGNVAAAKAQADGTLVGITGGVVTGVYDGFFYVEDTSRATGIKVVSDATVYVNDVVDVIGTLGSQNGEKYVSASQVNRTGTGTIAPLGMNNRAIVGSLTTSLLVKAWGKVVSKSTDGSYLYVDDGSGLVDTSGNKGVRVQLSYVLVRPNVDLNISVIGVAGVAEDAGNAVPVIRPRTDSDIL